jgi:hypothetical protein
MSLGGQRVTLAASGFLNENAPNQKAGPMQILAVVNTIVPLTATMNTVTLATTTTGTIVELITTTSISVPHSFLLPIQLYPRNIGLALAKTTDAETQSLNVQFTDEQEKPETQHQILRLETYPNPTTERVNIRYEMQKRGEVRASLYDAFGQVITHFAPLWQEIGEHIIQLDMSALPRGAYQFLITTPTGSNRAKVMVVR